MTDKEKRKQRWNDLTEDGEMFGLTPEESRELAELEEEFGHSGLPESLRS